MRNTFKVKQPCSINTKQPLSDDELDQIKNRISNITTGCLPASNRVVEVNMHRCDPQNVEVTIVLYHEVSQEKLMEDAMQKIVKACWNMQYAMRFEYELINLNIPVIV